MRTLETLFFFGYDLSQASELYVSFGFCLLARDNDGFLTSDYEGQFLYLDFCTESAGNPFINLGIALTATQAREIINGLQDTPAFIRSNFTPSQIETILEEGYKFANDLGINLDNERRKQLQAEEFFTLYPTCDVYECKPDYLPKGYKNAYIYPNEEDEYILVYPPLKVYNTEGRLPYNEGLTLANGERCILIPESDCKIINPKAIDCDFAIFRYKGDKLRITASNFGKRITRTFSVSALVRLEKEEYLLAVLEYAFNFNL